MYGTRFSNWLHDVGRFQRHRRPAHLAHDALLFRGDGPHEDLGLAQLRDRLDLLPEEVPQPAGIAPEQGHEALFLETGRQHRLDALQDITEFVETAEQQRVALQHGDGRIDLGEPGRRQQAGLQRADAHQPDHVGLTALRAVHFSPMLCSAW
jgi:hypothetical protein